MNDIAFTFGIITNAENGMNELLPQVLLSIFALNIPEYEILIVGTKKELIKHQIINNKFIKIIDFDEKKKAKWITKKKNIITQNAKYDNIVYLHDYISFDKDWYNYWKKFGDNFDACMNAIINKDGTRYRDWSIFPQGNTVALAQKYAKINDSTKRQCLLPYDELGFSKIMYFSGAYWVAKKKIMEKFPLNEALVWGKGEDVEWSNKFRKQHNFSLNAKSKIHLLRQKSPAFTKMSNEIYQKMKEYLIKNNIYRI